MKPTFAAIIPNYNDSAHIAGVLRAVREQTSPFDEVVIIDDASTDDSVRVIEGLIRDMPQARLYRNEANLGVVATLNRGVSLITSDYVHTMSANDAYFSRIVEYGQKAVARYPGVAMISGNSAVFDAVAGAAAADMIVRLSQNEAFITPLEYAAQNRIAPVSLCGGANTIRRDILTALGGQDPGLKWYADWFLYFLIGLTHGFAYVPAVYVTCRIDDAQSFSGGRFDWRQQRPVLIHLLVSLRERFPLQAALFRQAALLPQYNLRVLALLLQKPYRWFVTPLLVWRCVGHQAGFWLKGVLPRAVLMRLRSVLRL